MIIPFTREGEIDYRLADEEIDYVLSAGATGLYINGYQTEYLMLSPKEKGEVTRHIAERVNGRVPVIGNILVDSPYEGKELARMYREIGLDAIMLFTPFTFPFAPESMKLALVDIDEADLTGTAAVLENMGAEVLPIRADVTLYDEVKASVAQTVEKYGQIDVFFCNAGISPAGDIFHLPVRDWHWAVYANLLSHAYYYREVLPIMNLKDLGLDYIKVGLFCPGYVQTELYHTYQRRPACYIAPDDPYYKSEYYLTCLKGTENHIMAGIPLDGFGERLFKGMDEGTKYILTHEQYMEDGTEVELKRGDITYVPADERHKLINTGDGEFVFLFIYAPMGPEKNIRKWDIVEGEHFSFDDLVRL